MSATTSALPLAVMRVLDLSRVLAAPPGCSAWMTRAWGNCNSKRLRRLLKEQIMPSRLTGRAALCRALPLLAVPVLSGDAWPSSPIKLILPVAQAARPTRPCVSGDSKIPSARSSQW